MNWSKFIRGSSLVVSFLMRRERMLVMACFVLFNTLEIPDGEIPALVSKHTCSSVYEMDGLSSFKWSVKRG